MQIIYPGTSGASIISQTEVDANVRFRRSPQPNLPDKQPQAKQLSLPLEPLESPQFKPQKPQISSIPGVSPKLRNRYQVRLGDELLGTHLTIDEAIRVAKGGDQNG
jgi:hypothetical protein